MRKMYMPQRVFNAGAATVAAMYLNAKMPIEEVAAFVFRTYRDSYTDDGTAHDWVLAAQQTLKFLDDVNAPEPRELLRHFFYFVSNFESDGRPRRKRLFSGTSFNQAAQNLNRKEDYLRLLEIYYFAFLNSDAPLAPDNWPKKSK